MERRAWRSLEGGKLEAGTCLARRHELVARLLEEERLDARASTQAVRPVVLLVEAPVRRQARCALTAGNMLVQARVCEQAVWRRARSWSRASRPSNPPAERCGAAEGEGWRHEGWR